MSYPTPSKRLSFSTSRDGILLAALTVLAAGVILSFWRLHMDNNDAAVYSVMARRLVEERTPFHLTWLRHDFVRASIYEHPPLFTWIQALLIGLFPGFDLRLLGALCGVLTVVFAFLLGREVIGLRASFLGCLILIATESFSGYQPLARFDQPLVLSFTASMAVLVLARGRLGWLFAGGLVAGLGSMVKGPPALVAPSAAAILIAAQGRWDILKRPQVWMATALGMLVLPALFLMYDQLALNGIWWTRYVIQRLSGSVAGARRQQFGPFALLSTNVWRFWPGLPFVAIALARAVLARWFSLERARSVQVRLALLAGPVLLYVGYAPSGYRYWWYLLPAYVPLALLAGVGAEDLLARSWVDRFVDRAAYVVLGVGLLAILLLPFKVLAPLERPCPFGDLPRKAHAISQSGQTIVVVSPDRDYSTHVIFADHCQCDPVLVSRFQDADRSGVEGVLVSSSESAAEGWRVAEVHGRWAFHVRAR